MPFFITINGKRVEAREGEYLLATARRAGIPIPTLCEHKAVEPFGACRLCMVEVTKQAWKGWKGLMTACLYPAAPDLIVETDSERVRQVRKNVLDLLLARCPESALIQRLAVEYGVEHTSFTTRDSADLCILCGLCVRVCEAAATSAISTMNRGRHRAIGTPFSEPPPDCTGCLACAHSCPTGNIAFVELGGRRQIWGRTFELETCSTCGRPLPITKCQADFLAKRQGMERSCLARCAECQRRETAVTFSRIAQWNELGMVQEVCK
ncbi:MAG: 2Fe-2S iron-sulfur cluster-binding protein [Pseudomonadota bacterium]